MDILAVIFEYLGRYAFLAVSMLLIAPLLTWVERKQSAVMQDRIGANRAGLPIPFTDKQITALGTLHALADSLKLFTKEHFVPQGAHRFIFTLAPCISMFFAVLGFAVLPHADTLIINGNPIPMQIVPANVGILFFFAVISLAVYGVVLGAWASNNNYALLGGLRASAQILSYEVALGVSLVGIILCYGTLDLMALSRAQGELLWGWLPMWGLFLQPLGFLIFLTAGIAETKRIPFDAPEGESEIVGYFIEYSGMAFGMYFLTDFLETILIASLTVVFFLGGFQIPFVTPETGIFASTEPVLGGMFELGNLLLTVAQFGAFFIKVWIMIFLMMTIRWTLPRFRYDQMMHLGWKLLLPASLFNIFATALLVYYFNG